MRNNSGNEEPAWGGEEPANEASFTQSGYEILLSLLRAEPDDAESEYQKLRRKLIVYAGRQGAWFPHDDADEAIDRLCRQLQTGFRPDNLYGYLCGVLRKVVSESRRKQKQDRRDEFDETSLSNLPIIQTDNEDPRIDLLKLCLKRLPPEERILIIRYYSYDGHDKIAERKQIAAELGLKFDSLKMRACRAREKLRECFGELEKKV